ncbi:MAG: beta-ketoacyl-ACP synthase III [Planctomycetota bacterium]|jgi:3-oxoacyl-[acyl-carrier-protein] synthase-3
MNKSQGHGGGSYRAVIAGYGSCVPEKKLTNDDIAKLVETSDEWIKTRTGIEVRRIAGDGETTASLASEAAKIALAEAKLEPSEIEMVLVATITPEMVTPSTAAFVKRNLKAENAWGFDLQAACSGFVYAVSVGQQFIETGRHKNVLVIGAETLSRITNWQDRASCILFGDGAGAVVLQRGDKSQKGIIHSTMASDADSCEVLDCPAYGSMHPANKPLDDPAMVYMQINGREIYQQAVRRIVETVNDGLDHCGLTMDDVKMVISHQMNARIIESAAKRLKLPDEKVFINIAKYGNTSAASIPIAFDQCVREGKLKRGDIFIFVAFGAGLAWGANIIEF